MKTEKKSNKLFEDYIFPAIEKFTSQKHIVSISEAMMIYMPFTIVGAFALIIAYFPNQAYLDFITKITGMSEAVWQSKLCYFNDCTISITSIICVMTISYSLAKKYKTIDPFISSIIALVSIFMVTPNLVTDAGVGLNVAKLGTSALIVAIIVSIISTELFRVLTNKNIKIKMPPSVPSNVSQSFEALIPMSVVLIFWWFIRLAISATSWEDMFTLINAILAQPLKGAIASPVGIILAFSFGQLLWFCGIHGSNIVMGVITPFLLMASDANRVAYEAGEALPNIVTYSTWFYMNNVCIIVTLSLVLFAKSKQLREVGRVSFIPSIFNIGEPWLFGIPIMFNFLFIIPYILVPASIGAIFNVGRYFGLVAYDVGVILPWTTPPLLYGFLSTGGKISAVICTIVAIAVGMAILYPFLKKYDNMLLEKEKKAEYELTSSTADKIEN